ncbi:MAG: methionine biosynthesis protein MetW [Actinobacteria bacterium]|nr:methionine biosynthesis protein MetW [Actinomycetota bacterium]
MRRFEIINNWIDKNSKVLVLGCGNGDFLVELNSARMTKSQGIDINSEKVYEAISRGLSVIQGDINTDLADYPENSFDYIIAHDVIQIMEKPDAVVKQIIKLGRNVIISFPNFAYLPIRLTIFFSGRMPKTKVLPYEWYDSPNIHLFTIKDFKDFCKKENIIISRQHYTGFGKRNIPGCASPNLFSEFAYFMISGIKK